MYNHLVFWMSLGFIESTVKMLHYCIFHIINAFEYFLLFLNRELKCDDPIDFSLDVSQV